ncbi:MAG TPA: hypothetical protein VD866_08545 [Urbifossiella sp.]|nr:hypothetical protein [Urbifossiella sp.]
MIPATNATNASTSDDAATTPVAPDATAPATSSAVGQNATAPSVNPLLAELDGLIGLPDQNVKFDREAAKRIGEILTKIKDETFKSNVPRFNKWFTERYRRTSQSALQWMLLNEKWDSAKSAHDASTSPEKGKWEELSIAKTIALTAKPKTPKELADAEEATVAKARAKVKEWEETHPAAATSDATTTTVHPTEHPEEGDPTHFGTRQDEEISDERIEELAQQFVATLGDRVISVKPKGKVFYNGKWITVEKPTLILLMPTLVNE